MSTPKHANTSQTDPANPDTGMETSEYQPVFSARTRTGIYIVCLALVVIGTACTAFGQLQLGDWLANTAGIIAAGFGVAYNPTRLNKIS